MDDPLATFAGSGTDGSTAALLKADPRGSIVATTDWNGNLQVINTYDVYGIPGTGNSGRFQYTGQVWLPEIGLYYYKARIYSPSLGRFLQTDPIGYEDNVNLYDYVAGDPVNGVDPTGEEVVYPQDEAEAAALLAAMVKIVSASPELGERYETLRTSPYVHEIRLPQPGESPANITTGEVANESNGVGTGSLTIADPTATITTTNSDGSLVQNSPEAVIAHEFLGHGYDKDQGKIDRTVDQNTGNRKSEDRAMEAENKYKDAVGEKRRDVY